jgi:hypothetical protein
MLFPNTVSRSLEKTKNIVYTNKIRLPDSLKDVKMIRRGVRGAKWRERSKNYMIVWCFLRISANDKRKPYQFLIQHLQ